MQLYKTLKGNVTNKTIPWFRQSYDDGTQERPNVVQYVVKV